jgi:TonB family protein
MYMEMHAERNRLGMTFAFSVVIHFVLLVLIALFAGIGAKPLLPETNQFAVELLELPQKVSTREAPEETKRIAETSRKVEKETIVKEVGPEAISAEIIRAPSSKESSDDKREEAKPSSTSSREVREPLVIKEKTSIFTESVPQEEEKSLPSVDQLTPSYEKLALQYELDELPRHVEEGKEISLNTTEFKYVSYFSKLKRKIKMVWKYPETARVRGLQGTLTLKFVLNGDGSLRDVRVVQSSGYQILDEGAVEAVKKAAPFYSIPEVLGDNLPIVADFQYQLSTYYVR